MNMFSSTQEHRLTRVPEQRRQISAKLLMVSLISFFATALTQIALMSLMFPRLFSYSWWRPTFLSVGAIWALLYLVTIIAYLAYRLFSWQPRRQRHPQPFPFVRY